MAAIELNERFFAKTVEVPAPAGYDLDTPCRIWIGSTVTNSCGMKYGKTRYGSKFILAHRLAAAARAGWTLEELRAATKLPVLHGCDRPLCVCHGRFGTQSENMLEMHARGRHRFSKKKEA